MDSTNRTSHKFRFRQAGFYSHLKSNVGLGRMYTRLIPRTTTMKRDDLLRFFRLQILSVQMLTSLLNSKELVVFEILCTSQKSRQDEDLFGGIEEMLLVSR